MYGNSSQKIYASSSSVNKDIKRQSNMSANLRLIDAIPLVGVAVVSSVTPRVTTPISNVNGNLGFLSTIRTERVPTPVTSVSTPIAGASTPRVTTPIAGASTSVGSTPRVTTPIAGASTHRVTTPIAGVTTPVGSTPRVTTPISNLNGNLGFLSSIRTERVPTPVTSVSTPFKKLSLSNVDLNIQRSILSIPVVGLSSTLRLEPSLGNRSNVEANLNLIFRTIPVQDLTSRQIAEDQALLRRQFQPNPAGSFAIPERPPIPKTGDDSSFTSDIVNKPRSQLRNPTYNALNGVQGVDNYNQKLMQDLYQRELALQNATPGMTTYTPGNYTTPSGLINTSGQAQSSTNYGPVSGQRW